jgi:hypothetical protein
MSKFGFRGLATPYVEAITTFWFALNRRDNQTEDGDCDLSRNVVTAEVRIVQRSLKWKHIRDLRAFYLELEP